MKDLRLWQLLDPGKHQGNEFPTNEQQKNRTNEDSEMKALLEQLSSVGPRARMPFLSRLHAFPKTENAELRELQMRVLAGMSGWTAWQIMLNHAQDPVPTVRQAATAALIESSKTSPWLLTHVVFHPDPEIRIQTVEHFAASRQSLPAVLLYLLTDERCRSLVTSSVERHGLALRAAPQLVVSLHGNRLLSDDLTRRLIATMSRSELSECLEMLPSFSEIESARILAETGPMPTDWLIPAGAEYDGLQWMFELFWELDELALFETPFADEADPVVDSNEKFIDEENRELAARFVGELHSLLSQDPSKYASRATACLLATANKTGQWNIRLAGYCAALNPQMLLQENIPREVRRKSAGMLYRLRGEVVEDSSDGIKKIIQSDFCRRESGQLDLWLIGAVLHYAHNGGIEIVLECFTENQIIASFLGDPNDSVAFFSYSGSVNKRQALLEAIRAQRSPMSAMLEAMLVHVVPSDGLQFLDSLNGKNALLLLVELIKLAKNKELKLSAHKISVVGSILNDKLSKEEAKSFMRSWLQQPDPHSFLLGLEVLALFARLKYTTDELIVIASTLSEDALQKLLKCIELSPGFPYGTEVHLAASLVEHPSQPIRDWATPRAPNPTAPPKSSLLFSNADVEVVAGTPYLRLGPTQAAMIEACPETVLKNAVEDCLKAPTIGVCAALAPRTDPLRPNLIVATALLACADSIAEIDEQFSRFASTDRNFLADLDASMVEYWGAKDDLPVLATAWLCRWEKQAFEFASSAMGNTGQLIQLLKQSAELKCAILENQIWFATRTVLNLWRYRKINHYAEFVNSEFLELVASELTGRSAVTAAEILVAAHKSNRLYETLGPLKVSVIESMPDLDPEVRKTLQPWIDSRGFSNNQVVSRSKPGEIAAELDGQINRSIDIERLMQWCRHSDVSIVTNAALRCVSLGGKWLEAMLGLFLAIPEPAHPELLAETISLWPEEFLEKVKPLVFDLRMEAMTRFLVGLNLVEAGKSELLEPTLEIALEDVSPSWLQWEDLDRLKKVAPGDAWLACRLATSPHPHAYRFAVETLIGSRTSAGGVAKNPAHSAEHASALRRFLDCGTERIRSLRLDAAVWLQRCGDNHGYPLLLEAESESKQGNSQSPALAKFPPGLVEESVNVALLAGAKIFPEEKVLMLLQLNRKSSDEYHAAAIELNTAAVSNKVRQRLARHLRTGLTRTRKLREVASTFAWGIPKARELTERLFTIEMIGGDDYGYTRLHENKIYINPLPILQQKPNGRAVVEGLILHELGHHMYHRGKRKEKIWDQAHEEGLGRLLNLVSDEHLERRLRALDRGFGDRLKKLGAHVFQHSNKEVHWQSLLESLNLRSFEVLSASRMKVARRPNCVRLSTRRVMQEMEKTGMSFSRFFRALRLGLGNRYNDPKVAEALKLFGKDFRNSSMNRLYEITLRLREIFGSECEILNCFDQSRIVEGEGSQVMIDGEGITNGDIQSEIQRITKPPGSGAGKKGGGGRCINVGDDLEFERITMIERVNATRSEHAKYANDVTRYANQLRRYLSELGLVMVPQRRRIRGRSIDRASLQTAILKRDPRILKLREPRYETDLFIGVVIDCSGSMEYDDNIEKAKLFGALLTEAVRGMTSIDLRLFGFTDSVIYDAGTADRPGLAALEAGGGNNDAAALLHAAEQAQLSRRRAKLLVMISDGLPTECSVEALRSLVATLTRKWRMCCAQVAVQPLEEICFPNYVLLDTSEPAVAVREFGMTIAKLIRKSMAQTG